MSCMQRYPDADRWSDRLARWSRRLHTLHLTEPVGTLLAAVEPLGPLGAQMLWIAQPTLGLFVPREDVAALARLLEAPEGMAWVREQLTGPDDESQ